mgnify:CR=1 FL=1
MFLAIDRVSKFTYVEFRDDAGKMNGAEFLRGVVSDLFTDQVFVFTPKGDVLDFPVGATPVDAAYRIHSDLGQHCVGAKVNGKIVPLTSHFKNGDIVEILARPSANPSLDWLASAKTSHARTKIKAYFRKLRFAANVARGRELLQKELERLHLDTRHLMSPEAEALAAVERVEAGREAHHHVHVAARRVEPVGDGRAEPVQLLHTQALAERE